LSALGKGSVAEGLSIITTVDSHKLNAIGSSSDPTPFGTLFTAPIINQPQVGILSMDAVKKRPHVIETAGGDSIAIRPVGILAHSFDHRAVDGAYSAAYLQRLQSIIQQTDWDSEF
jgi:pyruvate/2-oxoglutarate dehydrogenase complex dihydrolipoamide acyltransferase (E2) component